jgi:hypothetical protein
VWLGSLAQVVLFDGAVSKIKKPESKAKLAARRALYHVMAFQHHQETVRGALVKLQR